MQKSFEESKLVSNSPETPALNGLRDRNTDEKHGAQDAHHPFSADLLALHEDRPTPALSPSSLLVSPSTLPSMAMMTMTMMTTEEPPVTKKQRCSSPTLPAVDVLVNNDFKINMDVVDFSLDLPKRKIPSKSHFHNPLNLSTHPRLTLSTQGTGPGEFDYPWGVTFDAHQQRIAVVDSWNHRVQLFDVQGNFLSLFGGPGSAPGRFSEPRGICIQHGTNNIVVADTGNHRLQVFSSDHQFLFSIVGNNNGRTPDSKLKKPYGLTSNRRGHLVVSDVHHHRVQILDSKGVLLRSFGSHGASDEQFDRPSDVFVDEHGRLLIADWRNSRISIWSGDGSTFLHNFRVPSPDAVCVDSNNRIVVGCGNPLQHASYVSIYEDQSNRLIHQIRAASDSGCESDVEPRQLDFPAGVCALEDGSLVFTDCNNQRVLIF